MVSLSKIRRVARWAMVVAAGLVGTIFVAVVAEFFIELAKEWNLYEKPSEKLSTALSYFSDIFFHPAFPWVAGIILGFAAGVWLDVLLRRLERGTEVPTPLGEIFEDAIHQILSAGQRLNPDWSAPRPLLEAARFLQSRHAVNRDSAQAALLAWNNLESRQRAALGSDTRRVRAELRRVIQGHLRRRGIPSPW